MRQNRWLILFFSVLSMVAVANFQYGWTLFVPPLQKHLGAEQAAVQVTFTVFVLLETWLVPFEGWLVDKFGPRILVMAGGISQAMVSTVLGLLIAIPILFVNSVLAARSRVLVQILDEQSAGMLAQRLEQQHVR